MMILSSDEKQLLYRIQTSTSDIDAIILVDNPAYNIVANIEVRFGIRSRWFNWSPIKYDVKIYSDIVPDVVYFLLLTVMEQRGLSKELSLL
ncbi:unnamed protein product [Rotaria magnacalcarata]|uniref:Uncharacterized protein n=1 Tax=Rotaria magnacalcarata TaxID=392030 RepID=A0A815XSZ3_9BILA|nr:unnamed protein product [Rotaria magnacalcarata]